MATTSTFLLPQLSPTKVRRTTARQLESAMERSNKLTVWRSRQLRRSSSARHGKLTLVTLIAILGMAVIIGFLGNAGYVVTEKMNTQNAADAIAFSSAQWMARGMN